ncbi:MAG: hypothetical protein ACLQVY_30020 [Limisphaerales bacterium]
MEALVELLTDGQREPGDFAVARHRGPPERGIVFMRGNDNRNASRLKSYGRFLNGFYVLLMSGDFIENRAPLNTLNTRKKRFQREPLRSFIPFLRGLRGLGSKLSSWARIGAERAVLTKEAIPSIVNLNFTQNQFGQDSKANTRRWVQIHERERRAPHRLKARQINPQM